MESNITAFLVRSMSSEWRKGSIVALDAGIQLSAIARMLKETQPPDLGSSEGPSLPHTLTSGPFAGLEIPFASADANAAHIHRNLIDTYLITHPHLDHISGLVVNTAGLGGLRPKRLAGLPSTIAALKTHIFNNVIWPNLSDENNGAGLVTYLRLVEGGSPALGSGDGKGYTEVNDGLAVKIWSVSHGHCIEKHAHRGSGSSSRYGSMDASSMSLAMGPIGMGMGSNSPLVTPRGLLHQNTINPSLTVMLQQHQQRDQAQLASTPQGVLAGSSAPSGGQRSGSVSGTSAQGETTCVYDSSAFFIRDVTTGREILMFGDVEPDSLSLNPRNRAIWQEAAPKIAAGTLVAIFIECSHDDSITVDRLFGHLAPRFLMQEMTNLADEVRAARRYLSPPEEAPDPSDSKGKGKAASQQTKKRKRSVADTRMTTRRMAGRTSTGSSRMAVDEPVSPKTVKTGGGSSTLPQAEEHAAATPSASATSPNLLTPTAELSLQDPESSGAATPSSVGRSGTPLPPLPYPLKGLKVVIIHMKDKPNDGPPIGDLVLAELLAYEEEAKLGCEFIISYPGQSLTF